MSCYLWMFVFRDDSLLLSYLYYLSNDENNKSHTNLMPFQGTRNLVLFTPEDANHIICVSFSIQARTLQSGYRGHP